MRFKNILLALVIAATGAGALATGADATTNPSSQRVHSEQARALGLTDTETVDLQRQVEANIAMFGGHQVAINKIDLDGGGFVLLTLPGETYARDLGTVSATGASSCPYLYLCAFKGANFTGNIIGYTICEPDYMPWNTTGSYVNNQTSGTVARFILTDGSGSNTGPAYYQKTPWNWAWTSKIDPC